MELFNPKKLNVDFSKYFKLFTIVSFVAILLSIIGMITPGINFGIDFRGGIEAQVKFAGSMNTSEVRKVLDTKLKNVSIVAFEGATATENEFSVTAQGDDKGNVSRILAETLTEKYGPTSDKTWTIKKMDVVGPKAGASLKRSAFLSLV